MNVSLQNIDKVSAELTVKLEKADYQEKVDKELKSLRQKAQIPGFRKGMVPTSLIKKMYGKSVIAEVVNKALQEAVYNYIKDNKVNMLGEPLPNEEKQQNIDFDTMEEFDFVFDIALAPEFKAEVSAKDKVDYYSIEVSEEMIDNQVKMYTQRTGKYIKIKYITQLPNTQVPSFVYFANLPQYVKDPYKRFLENKMREKWNLTGTPVNIYIRQK